MPVKLSQRQLTQDERAVFRNFREKPSFPFWALRVLGFCILAGTCCGGLGQWVLHSVSDVLTTTSSRLLAGGMIAGILGTGYFLMITRDELRQRRRRSAARQEAAESGVVEITEVEFDRMWTVTNHPDKKAHVVLESHPHLLVMIPVPADEDEHEQLVKGVLSRHEPEFAMNGTFPRRKVVIERVHIPGRNASPQDYDVNLTLSISWLGDRMESAGEVDSSHFVTVFDDDGTPSGLWTLRDRVPRLVRGPWMTKTPDTPQRVE